LKIKYKKNEKRERNIYKISKNLKTFDVTKSNDSNKISFKYKDINKDISNLNNFKVESRKVKFLKLYSENDYGDVNADEIELNSMMPNQVNLVLLYADVINLKKFILYK